MFTPQRKVWSGWSLTPRSEPAQKNGSGSDLNPTSSPRNGETVSKGKGIAFMGSTPPPPAGLLGDNSGNLENEGVVERISKLENELFEYQYNMGLLLIEKKEWTSKYEEHRQALGEAQDVLKREQAAHLIAFSEAEKREENLRKALGVEKQCVLDLEKALHEMRSDHAEIKFTADSKLAEANALVVSVQEKSLEVEAKVHAADAKLAEVSRKSSEIERKLHEVEAQENALRRDRLSFNSEREAHENSISKQREDLREWERKLQEGEERLSEGRRLLNQREQRANENDRILKQKHSDLDDVQKKIDLANATLKKKEEDIGSRLANLALKEKQADAIRMSQEKKEKELLELEEKLNVRERVEIQKLLDEHKTLLDVKRQEFEFEMDQKRKSLDEDLKNKVVEVERKEAEVNHMEEKVAKREQALEKKLEKFKEKEKDFESKSKALKEREKSVKVEERNLENEKKLILADKQNMLGLKVELERMQADLEEQQLKINKEKEDLKVTEEERSEHARLQSQLKQEIDDCRIQRELLLKEAEDLKQEKEKFEKEWEDLDEKRVQIKKELEDMTVQKEKLQKLKRSEEERLNNEKLETQNYVREELEALRLAKDSFTASMEHEKSIMAEKFESEKSQMLQDFERQKRELETEMRRKQEEMDHCSYEREKLFEEERDKELNKVNYLREVAQREMVEMKVERLRLQKEQEEISANQKHLEGQQLEMRKDIDELVGLSRKLKDQREQFMKERERFVAFVEKQKSCTYCGEITREFVLSDLQSLAEMDGANALPLPRLAQDYFEEAVQGTSERPNIEISPGVGNSGSPTSGETMSWLRKCTTKLFKFSPGKKIELTTTQNVIEVASLTEKHVTVEELPKRLLNTEQEPELSFAIANDSFDAERIQSDNSIREIEAGLDPSVDNSNISSKAHGILEDSQHSGRKVVRRKAGKSGRPRVNRTQAVKKVVAEANASLVNSLEHNEIDANGNADNAVSMNEESREESSLVGAGPRNKLKRNRVHTSQTTASEQEGGYSEGHSDSVTAEGRRKRRQKDTPAVQTPVEKRYNLRRHRTATSVAANGALSDPSKGKEKDGGGGGRIEEEIPNSNAAPVEEVDVGDGTRKDFSNFNATPAPSAGVASEDEKALRNTEVVHEFSSDRPIRDGNAENDIAMSEEVNGTPGARHYINKDQRSESSGEDGAGDEDNGVDDNDDEGEAEHPGEVSIGKKFWTFLTT
ncbi:unnamed protein product [Ilex paraguariensis]|uniref:Nuclear matrix constituent protein 1-like protein n=1 Tax=Ilex paraguariensis TaxID=185542 RepID=A0ABC8RLD5_9AQUA